MSRSAEASAGVKSDRALGLDGRLPRILTPAGVPVDPSLHSHLRRHGPLPTYARPTDVDRLWEDLARVGILGRGGAGFPLLRKLRSVPPRGRSPVVVANGTEGEPASDKDKVLLLQAPHLVLDGISVAVDLVGATHAVVVVPDEVLTVVGGAARERRRSDRVRVEVVAAARGFVAGEASAVVNWLQRGAPLPRMTPPRLVESGLRKRPTLVQNVETLAHLALVARHGAGWYAAVGTPEEPGSMLVTLSGDVVRSGVHEVAVGTPLDDLLEMGGVSAERLGALLVGGYSAAWVGARDVPTLDMSRASLRRVGASPGAGIVAALGRDRCGLVETARVLRYLAGQSAGQCGPCVFGLDAIANEFSELARNGRGDPALIRRWIGQVDGRGACAHPDGAARFARSALEVFGAEVESHLDGWCSGTSDTPVLPLPGLEEDGR